MVSLLPNAQSSGWSDLITGAQNDKRNDPVEEVVTPWALAGMCFWTMGKSWYTVGSSGSLHSRGHVPTSHVLFTTHVLTLVCCRTIFFVSWLGNAESGPAFQAAGATTRKCCSTLAWKKRVAKCRNFYLFTYLFKAVGRKFRLLKAFMHIHGEHWAALVLLLIHAVRTEFTHQPDLQMRDLKRGEWICSQEACWAQVKDQTPPAPSLEMGTRLDGPLNCSSPAAPIEMRREAECSCYHGIPSSSPPSPSLMILEFDAYMLSLRV